MNIITLLLVVIILVALLPAWPYSMGWGYYPSGAGLVLLILLVILLARGRP